MPLLLMLIAACTPTVPSPTSSPQARTEPTAGVTPTATRTITPTPTPTVTSTPTPLPTRVLLEPMNHQPQTLNNCGPDSVAILLGYYDHWVTQHEVKTEIQNAPQGSVSPCYIPWYVSRYGLAARLYRFPLGRDAKLLTVRLLLANAIPAIVFQRLSIGSTIGHFRVIQGYDDAAGEFISDDPYLGPDYRIPYDVFIRLGGGGLFIIPVYPAEMDLQVQSLMKGVGAYRWTNWDGLSCAELAQQR
jgi:hypothetical protein